MAMLPENGVQGIMTGLLGSAAALAIAFPLALGGSVYDPAAATGAARTGFYATNGAGSESVHVMAGGVDGVMVTHTGTGLQLGLTAGVVGGAPLNIPQGVAPTSPNNGDVWTTASGGFMQIAGVTYTLTAPGGAPIGGSITSGQVAFGAATANEIQGSTNITYVSTLASGGLTILNTTASTTTANGCLILSGGLGLLGAFNAGANSGITSTAGTQLTLTSTGGNAQVAFVPNAGTTYNVGSNGTNVFIFNGTANVLTVGGSSTTNSTITLTAATGHNPVLIYAINGVSEFETYAGGGGNYFMGDIVNGTTPMSYTGGAIGVGFVTFANTLDASSSTVAGHVLSGGLAVAKSIVTGGAITLNQAAGNAVLTVNAPTGSVPQLIMQVNAGNVWRFNAASSGGMSFQDLINGVNPIVYTPGTTSTGFVTFANTTAAATSSTGAVVVAGGVGVGGSIIAGANIVTAARLQSTAASTTFATGAVSVFRSGGTITPNTGDMVFQFDPTTNAGANGFYFAGGSSGVNLLSIVGGTVATVVVNVLGTTASTTTGTGALVVAGGLGVATASFFGGTINIAGNLDITSAGNGLRIKEGSNAKQGTATLTTGSVVVSNTAVTVNSRIFLTPQDNNTTGALRVSARTAGTSFTITSLVGTDSGVVAYEIFEPG